MELDNKTYVTVNKELLKDASSMLAKVMLYTGCADDGLEDEVDAIITRLAKAVAYD